MNRRFNNLFHQVPELWQQYKVKLPKEESDCDAAVAAVSSQLQRVAPFVREFSFMQPIEYEVQTWAVDSLLQLLPASLQRLHVGKPTPDEDEAALLRFTQLQHLELFQDFLPSTADAICQLQRLTSLRIGWSYVDDYEEADAYQLAQLGQLLELQVEVYTGGRLLLPPLADFSQLLVGFYTDPTIVVRGTRAFFVCCWAGVHGDGLWGAVRVDVCWWLQGMHACTDDACPIDEACQPKTLGACMTSNIQNQPKKKMPAI